MIRLATVSLFSFLLVLAGCQKQAEQAADVVTVDSVLSADSVMIYYDTQGQGDRALVLVHGWSCDRSYWSRQTESFKGKYLVVTVDLAGHGQSGANRDEWTIERFGDDVAAVVNKLGLKDVVLIGHSMGGPVCIEAARRLPDQVVGLVGVDTYQALSVPPTPEQAEDFIKPFRSDFVGVTQHFVRGFLSPESDSALIAQIADDMSSADSVIAIACFEGLFAYNPAEALKDMRKPIRSINCRLWRTDVEGNQAVAESFEVLYVENSGHFPQLEDPVAFNTHLRTILSEYWPQP